MFSTALTRLLEVQHPVLNAPMAGIAGNELALAVSAAGGLGMAGIARGWTEARLDELLNPLHESELKFGVGLISWALADEPTLLDRVLRAGPTLVSFSFGEPDGYVERCHEANVLVASQVSRPAQLTRALELGVDVLVVQGYEAGGHCDEIGLLPLLQEAGEMTNRPVVAAGGIATGRGLAAILAAGATGAWMGTYFLGAEEALLSASARTRLLAAGIDSTTRTRAYDETLGHPWPSPYVGRVVANDFARAWSSSSGTSDAQTDTRALLQDAWDQEDFNIASLYAGQAVGLVRHTRPAAELVQALVQSAERHLWSTVAQIVAADD